MDTFISLLPSFFGSGAAIAIITIAKLCFEESRERKKREEATQYLALLLAIQFEGYAIDCASKASDHKTAIEHEGDVGNVIDRVLQPQAPPVSESYQLLDRVILDAVFGFSQRCQMAQEAAMFWWHVVGDEDCCNSAMEENTIKMGGEALEISESLRSKYKLGDRRLEFGEWEIRSFFKRELKLLQDKEAKRKQWEAERIDQETRKKQQG